MDETKIITILSELLKTNNHLLSSAKSDASAEREFLQLAKTQSDLLILLDDDLKEIIKTQRNALKAAPNPSAAHKKELEQIMAAISTKETLRRTKPDDTTALLKKIERLIENLPENGPSTVIRNELDLDALEESQNELVKRLDTLVAQLSDMEKAYNKPNTSVSDRGNLKNRKDEITEEIKSMRDSINTMLSIAEASKKDATKKGDLLLAGKIDNKLERFEEVRNKFETALDISQEKMGKMNSRMAELSLTTKSTTESMKGMDSAMESAKEGFRSLTDAAGTLTGALGSGGSEFSRMISGFGGVLGSLTRGPLAFFGAAVAGLAAVSAEVIERYNTRMTASRDMAQGRGLNAMEALNTTFKSIKLRTLMDPEQVSELSDTLGLTLGTSLQKNQQMFTKAIDKQYYMEKRYGKETANMITGSLEEMQDTLSSNRNNPAAMMQELGDRTSTLARVMGVSNKTALEQIKQIKQNTKKLTDTLRRADREALAKKMESMVGTFKDMGYTNEDAQAMVTEIADMFSSREQTTAAMGNYIGSMQDTVVKNQVEKYAAANGSSSSDITKLMEKASIVGFDKLDSSQQKLLSGAMAAMKHGQNLSYEKSRKEGKHDESLIKGEALNYSAKGVTDEVAKADMVASEAKYKAEEKKVKAETAKDAKKGDFAAAQDRMTSFEKAAETLARATEKIKQKAEEVMIPKLMKLAEAAASAADALANDFVKMMQFAADNWKGILASLAAFFLLRGPLFSLMKRGIGTLFGAGSKGMESGSRSLISRAFDTIKSPFIKFGGWFADKFKPIGDAASSLTSKLKYAASGIARPIKDSVSPLTNKVASATEKVTAVPKWLKIGGGPVAGILGALTKLGEVADRDDLTTGQKATQVGATGIGAAVGTALGAFGGPIGMAIGGFLGSLLGEKIGEWLSDSPAVMKAFTAMGDFAGKIFQPFSIALGPVLDKFSIVWSDMQIIGEHGAQLFTDLVNGDWAGAWESFKNVASAGFTGLWDLGAAIMSPITEGAKAMWYSGMNIADWIGDSITSAKIAWAMFDLKGWFSQKFADLGNWWKNFSFTDSISKIGNNLFNGITTMLKKVADIVKNPIDALKKGFDAINPFADTPQEKKQKEKENKTGNVYAGQIIGLAQKGKSSVSNLKDLKMNKNELEIVREKIAAKISDKNTDKATKERLNKIDNQILEHMKTLDRDGTTAAKNNATESKAKVATKEAEVAKTKQQTAQKPLKTGKPSTPPPVNIKQTEKEFAPATTSKQQGSPQHTVATTTTPKPTPTFTPLARPVNVDNNLAYLKSLSSKASLQQPTNILKPQTSSEAIGSMYADKMDTAAQQQIANEQAEKGYLEAKRLANGKLNDLEEARLKELQAKELIRNKMEYDLLIAKQKSLGGITAEEVKRINELKINSQKALNSFGSAGATISTMARGLFERISSQAGGYGSGFMDVGVNKLEHMQKTTGVTSVGELTKANQPSQKFLKQATRTGTYGANGINLSGYNEQQAIRDPAIMKNLAASEQLFNTANASSVSPGGVRVSSGFRADAVNSKVGGAQTSAHKEGRALDMQLPGSPFDEKAYIMLAQNINANLMKTNPAMGKSMKYIVERSGKSMWLHAEIRKGNKLAPQLMTLSKGKKGNGIDISHQLGPAQSTQSAYAANQVSTTNKASGQKVSSKDTAGASVLTTPSVAPENASGVSQIPDSSVTSYSASTSLSSNSDSILKNGFDSVVTALYTINKTLGGTTTVKSGKNTAILSNGVTITKSSENINTLSEQASKNEQANPINTPTQAKTNVVPNNQSTSSLKNAGNPKEIIKLAEQAAIVGSDKLSLANEQKPKQLLPEQDVALAGSAHTEDIISSIQNAEAKRLDANSVYKNTGLLTAFKDSDKFKNIDEMKAAKETLLKRQETLGGTLPENSAKMLESLEKAIVAEEELKTKKAGALETKAVIDSQITQKSVTNGQLSKEDFNEFNAGIGKQLGLKVRGSEDLEKTIAELEKNKSKTTEEEMALEQLLSIKEDRDSRMASISSDKNVSNTLASLVDPTQTNASTLAAATIPAKVPETIVKVETPSVAMDENGKPVEDGSIWATLVKQLDSLKASVDKGTEVNKSIGTQQVGVAQKTYQSGVNTVPKDPVKPVPLSII